MSENILEILNNNHFVSKLFPEGLTSFAVGNICLRTDDRVAFEIHTSKKPSIEIKKWGKWGESYNTIVIETLIQFISEIQISNFQNRSMEACEFSVENLEGINELRFSGSDWSVCLKAKVITFQNCSVYINENVIV